VSGRRALRAHFPMSQRTLYARTFDESTDESTRLVDMKLDFMIDLTP